MRDEKNIPRYHSEKRNEKLLNGSFFPRKTEKRKKQTKKCLGVDYIENIHPEG